MDSTIWKTGLISHGPCQLEYKYKTEKGLPWMVFLHGFGQTFESFKEIYGTLDGNYSCLAFHLFFHGESSMEGKKPLDPKDWIELVEKVFTQLGIEKAHWLGFSMGGKFTLLTLQHLPHLFSEITLLAPDGLVMNAWYRFATQRFLGRFLLLVLIKYLPLLRYLILVSNKFGLIKTSVARFTEHQLSTVAKRELVLNVWLRFRNIWPTETIWRQIIAERKIPLGIVMGKHDSIITMRKLEKKRRTIPEVQWVELTAGHSNLIERFAKMLRSKLNHF